MAETAPRVGLFVTCLVDLFRPSVGFAAVTLLEAAGCKVVVPTGQTCCGQPAYNSGDRADAKTIAAQAIATFEGFDYVVAPSGSCAAMLRHHYPLLFRDEPEMARRAEALAARCYELVAFLSDVRGMTGFSARCANKATYHDSCSGLRELGVREQPRRLLASVEALQLVELKEADVCCGFGGTFCIKYPEISNAMLEAKTKKIVDSGADLLLAGDLGCLLNMAGKLKRDGVKVEVRHIAEVLADVCDRPAIGEPAKAE